MPILTQRYGLKMGWKRSFGCILLLKDTWKELLLAPKFRNLHHFGLLLWNSLISIASFWGVNLNYRCIWNTRQLCYQAVLLFYCRNEGRPRNSCHVLPGGSAMDLVQVTPPTPAAVKVLRPASDVPVLFGTLLVLEVPGFSGKCFGAVHVYISYQIDLNWTLNHLQLYPVI